MILAGRPPAHLTYCTNIHPGESWDEVKRNLETHVRAVKARVCPDRPFGVGLRLSNQASLALAQPDTLTALRAFLDENGLYVFTINGFPYGPFHGQAVKENVYRPDWLEDERLAYSDRLAHILAALLPRDLGPLEGSVSTVPGCFRARAEGGATAFDAMAARMIRHAATLHRIAESGGPVIGLALEPEPHCAFETIAETVAFFEQHVLTDTAARVLADQIGGSVTFGRDILHRHLGICLDACHAAVEFEQPGDIVSLLDGSGVRVLKIQVTTGLRLLRPTRATLPVLARFADDVYLHQTVVRRGRQLIRHVDLPDAIAAADPDDPGDEWRVHCHVPVFQADLAGLAPGFENTHEFLDEFLLLQARVPISAHLEVETYTWDVLPPELRSIPVDDAIARELTFTIDKLSAASRAT